MPGKVQLDKAAWQWVEEVKGVDEVTDQHVAIAYRLNLKPCSSGQCRRNCKGNPLCLNNLGEKAWYKELDENQWHDFNPEHERREEGKFVGLKNLGATCYVNTFLQLWFHNPTVKQALYRWRDPHLPSVTDDDWKPSSICGHLQLLFGLMEFSKKSYIDPTPLIESLGLDTKEQQDAQEFSKLFLSKLGEALTQGPEPLPSNIVQEQFAGSYCYVTRCRKCGSESSRESTFYELDINIQGQSTLSAALQEFLKEEKLEGENQYMCEGCGGKQNAVRSIQLRSLPPVLNLQLLRFVFDTKKGCKKKLKSFLQFPDVLDMSRFLGQQAMTTVYELTAVLIHRGPSAHSGHYIAHIQDALTKLWFRFNDEDITAMKGRRLELGKEDDVMAADLPELEEGPAPPKAPRTGKGQHSTRDAYMLVYTRREKDTGKGSSPPSEEKEASCDLPAPVMAYIEKDNASFENWIEEIALTRDANIFSGKEKQKLMQNLFSDLQVSSNTEDGLEWLPVDWLSSWLADPDKPQPINLTPYLCPHNRLHPDNVVKMKMVNSQGAEKLFEEYGGDLHLTRKCSLCMECVRQRCSEMQYREQITEHSRFLSAELKKSVNTEQECYWVGKTSLRCWKQYALNQIETTSSANGIPSTTDLEEGADGDGGGEREVVLKTESGEINGDTDSKDDPSDSDPSTSLDEAFNADLLCEAHGQLHPDDGCRRLVSESAWKRLRSLFPSCPQFKKDDPVCAQCQKNLEEEQAQRQECRQRCAAQRELFQDLYLGRNRPRLKQLGPGSQVYVVHSAFLCAWRKRLRNREGLSAEPLTEIVNKPLLCQHDKLLYPVDMTASETCEDIALLWDKEWEGLQDYYACDTPIEICVALGEGGQLSLISLPEVCSGCVAQRLQAEEEDLFNFEDETIYVRKVLEPFMLTTPTAEPPAASKYEEDPDFVEIKAKKPRLEEGGVRKSQRHRRQRGEKEVRVSSSMTLKEFKTKVMNVFSIATFDQNLSLDGRPVSSSEATLGQLRFYPGCVVIVKADEPSQDAVADIDSGPARKPEEGFKGTNLLSS